MKKNIKNSEMIVKTMRTVIIIIMKKMLFKKKRFKIKKTLI